MRLRTGCVAAGLLFSTSASANALIDRMKGKCRLWTDEKAEAGLLALRYGLQDGVLPATLSASQRQIALSFRQLRAASPQDPRIAEAQNAVALADSSYLLITDTEISLHQNGTVEVKGTYSIVSDDGNTVKVTIHHPDQPPEALELFFYDEQYLTIRTAEDTLYCDKNAY